ncbi:major facilitator superfamily domain-containing protein [Xylogone sp. PMI_703]|nr:major facilitator superfamily domain-containing protein [Xylogone sp. PMI_703]
MTEQQRQPQVAPSSSTLFRREQSDSDLEEELRIEKDIESGDTVGDDPNIVEAVLSRRDQAKDPNLIEWDGPDDPENPMNWPMSKKWRVTVMMGFMTFVVTFASSVFSNATIPVARLYDISTEVSTFGSACFVLGFSLGPCVWGPGSEVFGRKWPMFVGYFIFALFQIGVAVSENFYTIVLCRFFGGFFGCSPLAIVGGAFTDFWPPMQRGVAVCIFASATFIGPVAGPVMGGFITQSHLGWRWTEYITVIMAMFFGILGVFIIPESSHPRLLQQRARKIRHQTKNWAIHAKADEIELDPKAIINTYLFRPFIMLVQEPILILVTLYLALIYGLIYLLFISFPISFQQERGWNQGVGALPFLGIAVGLLAGAITIIIMDKTRLQRKIKKHGRLIPEERLPPMIIGAFILPIGLFWFAWTSSPHITWVPQVLASVPIGWGILMIFLQGLNYLIDVYLWYANSALAANTMVRSLAGAGFPMFAHAMYAKLGVDWATSLLGFLCVALIPVPIGFYYYGAKIRKLSKFSPKL